MLGSNLSDALCHLPHNTCEIVVEVCLRRNLSLELTDDCHILHPVLSRLHDAHHYASRSLQPFQCFVHLLRLPD
ncbi:hypothetical protein PMES_01663 [Profundibacterium mesophilum KAUST100406-0324]|uniref:Uncharacterized protein n=1 Tax=Profundibacterium mesophilum KAUST100406-0324 TaxID=1037889 RepID=A0A921NW82_9RHOB|nr:hypothetical protein PMES_01663 [Profundibacterium mesophilum KAUST100406-0324]